LIEPAILTGVVLVVDRQPVEGGLQGSYRHCVGLCRRGNWTIR
jgi:hypothetical protein